jgi:hypothetical protein
MSVVMDNHFLMVDGSGGGGTPPNDVYTWVSIVPVSGTDGNGCIVNGTQVFVAALTSNGTYLQTSQVTSINWGDGVTDAPPTGPGGITGFTHTYTGLASGTPGGAPTVIFAVTNPSATGLTKNQLAGCVA